MTGFTVFTTYLFKSNLYNQINSFGYTDTLHCGYINSIQIPTILKSKISLYFNDEFPFLNGGADYTGWTANKFYVLVQTIDNATYSNIDEIKPLSNAWKILELTDQVSDGIRRLTSSDMISNSFIIDLSLIITASTYNLDYLNYPTQDINNNLLFGDEQVFIGNIDTDIEAVAKVLEIPISLPYDQFNISTNKTWKQGQDVYISEVGIYSSDGTLVAIGKFNNPIQKNNLIARTIKFELDF